MEDSRKRQRGKLKKTVAEDTAVDLGKKDKLGRLKIKHATLYNINHKYGLWFKTNETLPDFSSMQPLTGASTRNTGRRGGISIQMLIPHIMGQSVRRVQAEME